MESFAKLKKKIFLFLGFITVFFSKKENMKKKSKRAVVHVKIKLFDEIFPLCNERYGQAPKPSRKSCLVYTRGGTAGDSAMMM